MAEPEVQRVETISPTGEVVSPEVKPEVEEVQAGPAPAEVVEEVDQELLALQTAVDSAQTPEDKEKALGKQRGAWARLRSESAAARKAVIEAEKKAEFERGRAEALKTRAVEVEKPKVEEPAYVTPDFLVPRPKAEDFEFDDEKLEAAKEDWISKRAQHYAYHQLKAEQQKEQFKRDQEAARTDEERQVVKQQEWVTKGTEKYADFREVLEKAVVPPVPVMQATLVAENSQDIAYYLAKNPAEVQRLAGLSEGNQFLEIGKLAYKLSLPPAQPKTISSAPAPIAGLAKTETSGPVDIYDPNLSIEALAAVHPLHQKK